MRGQQSGPLFTRIGKGNRLTNERLTTQAVYVILKKRAAQAGVKPFSPHDMRRTIVGELLSRGADIATVAKMAGHSDVKTTARYDRRPEKAKRKAASLLHYPFEVGWPININHCLEMDCPGSNKAFSPRYMYRVFA